MNTQIDDALFREVLGHYPTGVVAVTGIDPEGELHAMILGTFTSVSLDPPLIGFLPRKESQTYAQLRRCEALCVNILTAEQEAQGRAIVSRTEDKLADIPWYTSPRGTPVLRDALAWIDVTITQELEAGDHLFTLCAVRELQVQNPLTPLLFFQGGYGSFLVPSLVARTQTDIREFVTEAAALRPDIEALAQRVGCVVQVMAAVNPQELMAVVSAAAPGLHPGEGLGEHVPMVPPIGDTVMAHASPDEVADWLRKAKGADEELLATYRRRLEFCREHGYLISWLPEGDHTAYSRMRDAAQQFASGQLTPAQEREVREAIFDSEVRYEPLEIPDGTLCDLGSLVLPILDDQENVRFTLRLEQFPRQVDSDTARGWIADATATADRVQEKIRTASASR